MCLQHSDPDEEKIIDLKTLKNKKLCKSWFTCGLWEHKDVTQFLSVQIEITHDTCPVLYCFCWPRTVLVLGRSRRLLLRRQDTLKSGLEEDTSGLETSPASPPGQCHFAGSFWMHFLHASLSATITQFAPRSAIVWCEFCVDPSLAWTITLHSLLGPFQSNLSRKFSKSDFVERNSISTLYDNDFWLLLYRIASIAFLFNWTSISKLRAVEMLRFSIQR